MKTIQISKSSWHYRFLAMLDLGHRHSDNICRYLRGLLIIAPLLLIGVPAIVLFVAVMALWGTGDFLGWLVAVLTVMAWIDPAHGPWPLGAAIVIVGTIWAIVTAIQKASDEVTGDMLPEIVVASWDSIHNRICRRIERTE